MVFVSYDLALTTITAATTKASATCQF